MDILAAIGAAATPLAVKHEKEQPDSAEGVSPEGGRRTSHSGTAESPHGKENSDAIHRLGILHAGKDSSPNTAAAEASAIAGMFALTQGLSRSVDFQEGTDDAIEKDDDEGCGDDAGDDAQASGSESSSRGVAASTSSQEECAAGALMAMGFAQGKRSRKRARKVLEIDPEDAGGPSPKPKKSRIDGKKSRTDGSGGRGKGGSCARESVGLTGRAGKAPKSSSRPVSGSNRRSSAAGGGLEELSARGVAGLPGGPIGAATVSMLGQSSLAHGVSPGALASTPGARRKPCNCKNSKCLKLYCECFAAGVYCEGNCNCQACHNNPRFELDRQAAIGATLERNPMAFRPKVLATNAIMSDGKTVSPQSAGRHMKGCHCKKSSCLKKYCECFQAGVMCSDNCKCIDCHNHKFARDRMPPSGGAAQQLLSASSLTSPAFPSAPLRKTERYLGEAASDPLCRSGSREDPAAAPATTQEDVAGRRKAEVAERGGTGDGRGQTDERREHRASCKVDAAEPSSPLTLSAQVSEATTEEAVSQPGSRRAGIATALAALPCASEERDLAVALLQLHKVRNTPEKGRSGSGVNSGVNKQGAFKKMPSPAKKEGKGSAGVVDGLRCVKRGHTQGGVKQAAGEGAAGDGGEGLEEVGGEVQGDGGGRISRCVGGEEAPGLGDSHSPRLHPPGEGPREEAMEDQQARPAADESASPSRPAGGDQEQLVLKSTDATERAAAAAAPSTDATTAVAMAAAGPDKGVAEEETDALKVMSKTEAIKDEDALAAGRSVQDTVRAKAAAATVEPTATAASDGRSSPVQEFVASSTVCARPAAAAPGRTAARATSSSLTKKVVRRGGSRSAITQDATLLHPRADEGQAEAETVSADLQAEVIGAGDTSRSSPRKDGNGEKRRNSRSPPIKVGHERAARRNMGNVSPRKLTVPPPAQRPLPVVE